MSLHIFQELPVDAFSIRGIPILACCSVAAFEKLQIAIPEVVPEAGFAEVEGAAGVADDRS